MSRYIQRWPENDLHEHHSTIVLPLLYKLSKLYPLHTLRKLGIDNNFKSITRKPEEIKQWSRDTNVFWKKNFIKAWLNTTNEFKEHSTLAPTTRIWNNNTKQYRKKKYTL